mgnify:CR=1 FL=1
MCKPDKNLKLCTCGDPDKIKQLEDRIWWKLSCGDIPFISVGEVKTTYHQEPLSEELILKQLNSANRFDFDYKPKEGDTLTINWEGKHFNFLYERGRWVVPFDDDF